MIIKLAFAFGAGFISFLTPCVLPIIPGYISYITGKNLDEIEQDRRGVLIKTVLFSVGFSLVFIVLGATASAVGNILLFLSNELRIAAGILIILFSLQMLGIFNFSFLNQEKRMETEGYKNNYAFPLLVGAAFAFGWTPCIGPVLGSILALSATEASISTGVLLLSFYSLGLAIPFILSGYYMSKFLTTRKGFSKYYGRVTKTGGAILLLTGVLIATNRFGVKSFDIQTGKQKWNTTFKSGNIIPRSWSGISYDPESQVLFVVTSNPGSIVGLNRKGEKDLSTSIIAINTVTGKILWSFQEVVHDLFLKLLDGLIFINDDFCGVGDRRHLRLPV